MKEKIIKWIKENKRFITFEGNNEDHVDVYMFRVSTGFVFNNEEEVVFIEYNQIENNVEIILKGFTIFSKPNMVFVTNDQELIDILKDVLSLYNQHTFNVVDSGFLIRIDEEENFRKVNGIVGLKEDLMNEAADEAIPEMESFVEELKKKIENKKTFYVKATLKLEYVDDYMFVEIIKL